MAELAFTINVTPDWVLFSAAVWLEQSNGDIFCLIVSAAETRILEISPPHFGEAAALLASTTDALWCLLASGRIYVRKGMSSLHVQGVEWTGVDLSQLGTLFENR